MSKYRLGDYTIKNWNSWDRVPRMPDAIAAYIISATGATGLTAAAITVGTYVAVSAVTSWAYMSLMPKPDLGQGSSGSILVNSREAAAPQDFVYGKVRKGGVVTFYEATGTDNTYLHQVIVLAGHEVNGIGDIYINDEVVSIDGNNLVTGDTWQNKIRIKKHDGSHVES